MREGLHWGLVPNANRTISPDRASRSMFGVRIPWFPYTPLSRQPRSSATSTRMLGRAEESDWAGRLGERPRMNRIEKSGKDRGKLGFPSELIEFGPGRAVYPVRKVTGGGAPRQQTAGQGSHQRRQGSPRLLQGSMQRRQGGGHVCQARANVRQVRGDCRNLSVHR